MSVPQVLALALAVSVVGNAALGWAWIGAREAVATTALERDNARASASACSDATDDLRTLADKLAADAKRAQAAAHLAAVDHQARAQTILATPAAVPGDACASAQVRIDGWLKGRAGQ
ncbi:hypothetical protein [Variovorax paradoxus]|uniref:hypothetical protein n=1 Tax=Variovorax paradoxus TaxID=34073 RepID=UPI003ECC1E35